MAATVAERLHMDRVAALGCIVSDVHCRGRVTIHHVHHGTARRDHMRVLPLCEAHHQTGPRGVAIHEGKKSWRDNYGPEIEYLGQIVDMLA